RFGSLEATDQWKRELNTTMPVQPIMAEQPTTFAAQAVDGDLLAMGWQSLSFVKEPDSLIKALRTHGGLDLEVKDSTLTGGAVALEATNNITHRGYLFAVSINSLVLTCRRLCSWSVDKFGGKSDYLEGSCVDERGGGRDYILCINATRGRIGAI